MSIKSICIKIKKYVYILSLFKTHNTIAITDIMHYITNTNQKVYQRFFQYHSFCFASQFDKCFYFHRLKLYYLFDIRQKIYYFPIHIIK